MPATATLAFEERAALERSVLGNALVFVHFSDCHLEILSCRAPGRYVFNAIRLAKARTAVESFAEASQLMPVTPSEFKRLQGSAPRLSIDSALVGQYVASDTSSVRDGMVGSDCALATHVVKGISVGAFALAREFGDVAAVAEAFATVKGEERKVVMSDGDPAKCSESTPDRPAPDCNVAIRLSLAPLETVTATPPSGRAAELLAQLKDAHSPGARLEILWRLSAAFYETEDWSNAALAAAAFETGAKDVKPPDPRIPLALKLRMRALVAAERIPEALEVAKTLVTDHPDAPEAGDGLALFVIYFCTSDQQEQGLFLYERLRQSFPSYQSEALSRALARCTPSAAAEEKK